MAFPWTADFPSIYSDQTVEQLSQHPLFGAAKHGDRDAAAMVVIDLADRRAMREVGVRYRGSSLIVVANPGAGGNQIPNAFAAMFAVESGLDLVRGVVKVNRPAHTAKGAAYRFAHRAQYDGAIAPGRSYVLLDDVSTQGGTISELRQWVYRKGGSVAAVATLAYTPSRQMSDGRTLVPSREALEALHRKHGIERVGAMLGDLGIYDGEPLCMTESEVWLVVKAPSLAAFVESIRREQTVVPMPPLPHPSTGGRAYPLAAGR